MDYLYPRIASVTVLDRQGLVVALGFRLITIVIAAVGIVYYWTSRKEVAEVLHEVEEEQAKA